MSNLGHLIVEPFTVWIQGSNTVCKRAQDKTKAHTINILCHVIVKDKRHIFDIDTTTSNIGSHQNVLCASLKAGESKLSLFLTFASVKGCSIVLESKQVISLNWVLYTRFLFFAIPEECKTSQAEDTITSLKENNSSDFPDNPYWENVTEFFVKYLPIFTPIFSSDFARTSTPFFWLTKMTMGGSMPACKISSNFFL